MQRSMGDRVLDQNGRSIVIGADIPPLRVMTIELRYSPVDQKFHNIDYDFYIENLHKSGGDNGAADDSSPGGRINMGLLRILCLNAFSPLLSKYLDSGTRAQTLSQFIGRLVNGADNGFEAFFLATCRDVSIPRLKDATEQAYYLCRRCSRLAMLLRIFDLEGAFVHPRPRFLLVCHWPMVAWMVEMFVVRLGLRTVSVTASKTAEECAAAVTEFTSPRSCC
ncbi:uncharacterized protein N7496_000730 [Penicillium cataractarum]|uniref:Uncharacterized protein n=1 Tax=Penicillium cataractarum TaxID=2100454 RepID=A0A9X0B6E1_9EURO|nr:uncharacterized protein N7496_000730 [Penicillium cataractarum]KAJ5389662.1 hypothetical protein N7496_000730 [Penicillium cataractarum]